MADPRDPITASDWLLIQNSVSNDGDLENDKRLRLVDLIGDLYAQRAEFEATATIIDRLRDLGFEEIPTGGGCVAMARDHGTSAVWFTDKSGTDLPTDSDWLACAHDEEGQEIGEPTFSDTHEFAAALADLTERAHVADVAHYRRRNGERD